jgi:hypothetical protein
VVLVPHTEQCCVAAARRFGSLSVRLQFDTERTLDSDRAFACESCTVAGVGGGTGFVVCSLRVAVAIEGGCGAVVIVAESLLLVSDTFALVITSDLAIGGLVWLKLEAEELRSNGVRLRCTCLGFLAEGGATDGADAGGATFGHGALGVCDAAGVDSLLLLPLKGGIVRSAWRI